MQLNKYVCFYSVTENCANICKKETPVESATTAPEPTTNAPTTNVPTTNAPTTNAPTTIAPFNTGKLTYT